MNPDMLGTDQLQNFMTCLNNQSFPNPDDPYNENDSLVFLPLASNFENNGNNSPNTSSDDGIVPPFPKEVVTDDYMGLNLQKPPQKPMSLPAESIEELLEEADLKRKRLARKAELARVSRKRKKLRIDELESEVADLKKQLENERKRARTACLLHAQQSSSSPNCTKDLSAAISAITQAQSTDDSQVLVQKFYNAFKKKVDVVTGNLDVLSQGSKPCLPVRFVQWLMSQNDKFYSDPNGLWSSLLSQEVGASPEQLSSLADLRKDLQTNTLGCWAEVDKAAMRLDLLLRSHTSSQRIRCRRLWQGFLLSL